MADKRKAILLRIAPELWEALNRWAASELRSVNAQIEYVLREAVRKRGGPPGGAEVPAVYAWLRKLADDLHGLGLLEWAQRVEGAGSFVGTPEEILANARATLGALARAELPLPPETVRIVRGLGRALGEPPPLGGEAESG
jgi:hypothetical protein